MKPLLGLGGSLIATVLSAAYTVMMNCCCGSVMHARSMRMQGTAEASISMCFRFDCLLSQAKADSVQLCY
jgi:hypothetical protein